MTTRPGYVWDATASEWVEIGQAAVVSPFKYQTSQPSSPATGDIWIDSDEDVPSVDSTLYYRWTKTMSGGETSLSGTDNNSLALKYTPGYESVFINGVLQVRGSDYVATTGTTVTGLTALVASDVVMVESIIAYSVGDTYTQSTLNTMFSPITTTGLVLLNSTTFSAVTSVSVSNVFDSNYRNYIINIDNLFTASSEDEIRLRVRADTTDLTGTNYFFQRGSFIDAGTSQANSASQTSFRIGSAINDGASQINVTICNPQTTSRTTSQTFNAQWTGGRVVQNMFAGQINNTTQYNGFTVFATQNISGNIKVYGYK